MDDPQSAGMQLESLLYYLDLWRGTVADGASQLERARSLLSSDGVSDTALDPAAISNLQNQVSTDGLSADTIKFLRQLGANDAEIAQATNAFLSTDPNGYSGSLYTALADANSSFVVPEPLSVAFICILALLIQRDRKRGHLSEETG
jgi:hypothetical protein